MSRRTLSPEEEAKIINLYNEGQNSNQIAKALGIAYQTVHNRVRKFEELIEQSSDGKDVNEGIPQGLTHISNCRVYKGAFLTFIHDLSSNNITIETGGHESIKLKEDSFILFSRDIELMKVFLSNKKLRDDV